MFFFPIEDLDRTLAEYEYTSMSEAYVSISKQRIENGTQSLRIKNKPMVPERDSSLYDCFTNSQSRSLLPATSVPNLSSIRCNSNSSSNEADEETSLSSMNSNQINPLLHGTDDNGIGIYMTPSLSLSTTNMSTFKTTTAAVPINPLPSKPSEVKRRSNHRKQIYAAINNSSKIIENENNAPPPPPPPPPPPLPGTFEVKNKIEHEVLSKPAKIEITNDFQLQIEQAKTRLKKPNIEVPISNGFNKPISSNNYHSLEIKNIIIEELPPTNGFPPPPSPTTLRRSAVPSINDPRLDSNFSSVIAQRAAAAKARRHENPIGFEYNLNKLPASTTFFNNCITTNGISTNSKLFSSYTRVD